MRPLLFGLCLLLLTGCATPALDANAPSATNTTVAPLAPTPDPLEKLAKFTKTDLTTALAQATSDQDQAGINCWTTLLALEGSGTLTALPKIDGLASAIQAKRHYLNSSSGITSVAKTVNVGCAALFMSEQATLLKLGLSLGGSSFGIPSLP